MQLVIAEKPSVGRDLARVLGVRASGRNVLEGPGRAITWCIGHLVELEEPAAYDPRWKAWRMDTLPMIPPAFKLRPVSGTRDQLRVVRDLLRDRRFSEVVNACDAGREGELIFRYVYELAGSRLPVRRLWISSLTDEAIHRGFADLHPGATYDPLADAARCRSEADWLVGMNATRAVTLRFRATTGGPLATKSAEPSSPATVTPATADKGRRSGTGRRGGPAGKSSLPAVYSIGRVQTPTLAILVRREQAIRAFQPRDYWEVRGTFSPEAMPAPGTAPGDAVSDRPPTFNALWTHKPNPAKGAVTRFGVRSLATEVATRTGEHGRAGDPRGPIVESLIEKRSNEPPPQLFDLTSLQRTANRRYGMSASRTLEAAQALYERHKVLTYPRTDSRHLPLDMKGELPRIFRGLSAISDYAPFALPLIQGDVEPIGRSRRVFDGAKVHDHHAIIPTGKAPAAGALGQDEQRVFDLVARRFLGAFHPDAVFALTEAVVRVGTTDASPGTDVEPDPTARAGMPGAPLPGVEPLPTSARLSQVRLASAPSFDEPFLTVLPSPPDRFVARGRVRLVAGWQAVAGFDDTKNPGARKPPVESGDTEARDDLDTTLPALAKGQRLNGRFEVLTRQTRPPVRHNEATLLGAMESAGREIDDETLRAAMKDTGLGTPATRAATIETLLKRGFITRAGKQVAATPAGIALIEGLPVPTLASPELTGAWEARLVRIARGQDTRAAFMTDIVRYVHEITTAVQRTPVRSGSLGKPADGPSEPRRPPEPTRPMHAAKAPASKSSGDRRAAIGSAPIVQSDLPCPLCQRGHLVAGNRGWGCSRWRDGCAFVIWFVAGGKRITDSQLRDLVKKGKTRKSKWAGPGRTSETGRLILDLTAIRERGAARFHAE